MSKASKVTALLLTLGIITALPFRLTAETILHTERSLYRNITVYESDDERCMRFTKQISARQSCISLKNPDSLVFNYAKMMLGALYIQPEPDKILIIGLGGGILTSTLSRISAESENRYSRDRSRCSACRAEVFQFPHNPRGNCVGRRRAGICEACHKERYEV